MSKVNDVLLMSESELLKRKTSITKDELIQALLSVKAQQNNDSNPMQNESKFIAIIEQQFEKCMQRLSSKIDLLLEANHNITERCNKLQNEIEILKTDKSENVTEEVTQRIMRRRNVIIVGIPECELGSVDERRKADEKRVREVFEELNCDAASFDEVTRLGRIQTGKNRLLRIKFEREDQRQQVLRSSSRLRETSSSWMRRVFINPDRTKLEQEQGRALRDELRRRRENGEKVFIRSGRVISESDLENRNFREGF